MVSKQQCCTHHVGVQRRAAPTQLPPRFLAAEEDKRGTGSLSETFRSHFETTIRARLVTQCTAEASSTTNMKKWVKVAAVLAVAMLSATGAHHRLGAAQICLIFLPVLPHPPKLAAAAPWPLKVGLSICLHTAPLPSHLCFE